MSAIFSGIVGAIGGIVTPIIQHKHKIEEENMRHTHELERLKIETKLQDQLVGLRMYDQKISQENELTRIGAEISAANINAERDVDISDNNLLLESYRYFGSKNKIVSCIISAVRPTITLAFVFMYTKIMNRTLSLFFVPNLSIDEIERVTQIAIVSSFIDIVACIIGFWFGNRAIMRRR